MSIFFPILGQAIPIGGRKDKYSGPFSPFAEDKAYRYSSTASVGVSLQNTMLASRLFFGSPNASTFNPNRAVVADSRLVYGDVKKQIDKFGLPATHRNSPEIRFSDTPPHFSDELVPNALSSSLFLQLARGVTSITAPTGKETALINEVLTRDDRSVLPSDLFSMSYLINSGDVFLSLLTAENVLTQFRWEKNREELNPIARKLYYLGDNEDGTGDNIGATYHFFGTALYAYAKNTTTESTLSVWADEIASFFMEPIDRHETYAGLEGAKFGIALRGLSAGKMAKDDIKEIQNRYLHQLQTGADMLIAKK